MLLLLKIYLFYLWIDSPHNNWKYDKQKKIPYNNNVFCSCEAVGQLPYMHPYIQPYICTYTHKHLHTHTHTHIYIYKYYSHLYVYMHVYRVV